MPAVKVLKLWRLPSVPVPGDYVARPLALFVVVSVEPIEHPEEDGWRCTVRRIGDTRGTWPPPDNLGAKVYRVEPCPDCPRGR